MTVRKEDVRVQCGSAKFLTERTAFAGLSAFFVFLAAFVLFLIALQKTSKHD
jgi:uncharacterized membrane protein